LNLIISTFTGLLQNLELSEIRLKAGADPGFQVRGGRT